MGFGNSEFAGLNLRRNNLSCSLGFWLKGSRFKGSEVDFTATLTNEINGKGKKRDGVNPEHLAQT